MLDTGLDRVLVGSRVRLRADSLRRRVSLAGCRGFNVNTVRHDVSWTLRWPGRVGRSPCLLGVVRQAVRQSVGCVSD